MSEVLGLQFPGVNIQIPFLAGILTAAAYWLYRRNGRKTVRDDQLATVFFLGAVIPPAISLVWADLTGSFLFQFSEVEKLFYMGVGGLWLAYTTLRELKTKFLASD